MKSYEFTAKQQQFRDRTVRLFVSRTVPWRRLRQNKTGRWPNYDVITGLNIFLRFSNHSDSWNFCGMWCASWTGTWTGICQLGVPVRLATQIDLYNFFCQREQLRRAGNDALDSNKEPRVLKVRNFFFENSVKIFISDLVSNPLLIYPMINLTIFRETRPKIVIFQIF